MHSGQPLTKAYLFRDILIGALTFPKAPKYARDSVGGKAEHVDLCTRRSPVTFGLTSI